MKSIKKGWLAIALSSLLAACGGGGGGSGSAQNGTAAPTIPTTPTTPTTPTIETTVLSNASAGGARTVIDAAGNAIVTWHQDSIDASGHSHATLWVRRYVPSGGWQAAQMMSDTDISFFNDYRIAMDPKSGRAMLIWQYQDQTTTKVVLRARAFDPATGWASTSTQLESDVDTSHPSVVGLDGEGNAIVIWIRYALINSSIFANRFVVGSGWGTITPIGDQLPSPNVESSPSLAVSANGDAIVVWAHSGTGNGDFRTNRFTRNGGWEGPSIVLPAIADADLGTIMVKAEPQVAMDANGRATLVWSRDVQSNSKWHDELWSKRYVSGWQAATMIASNTSGESTSAWAPTPVLAVSAEGAAAVAWPEVDASMYVAVATPDGTWGTPAVVASSGNYYLGWDILPVLNVIGQGDVTVAWKQSAQASNGVSADDNGIWIGRYTTTHPTWSTSLSQIIDASGSAEYPALARNEQGNTVLAWTHFDSLTGYSVFGRYQASGN